MWNSVQRIPSSNENVWKYVFTKDDAVAESVLYKYPTFSERTVICCSTQSGCPMGCRFCGAGDHFVRSLSADEIVSQPQRLIEDTGITASEMKRLQIMFMSMGEPMLNPRVHDAIRRLYQMYPNAALLVSTSAPKSDYEAFARLSVEVPTVGLQFSVHESTDEKRNELIPFAAKLTLSQIAEEGIKWYKATERRPFFNYCAHDKNSSDEDASNLRRLFDPAIWQATISVVCERQENVAAANARQRSLAAEFENKLKRLGYSTRMFDPAGQDDIGGGCGQLWYVQDWMRSHPEKAKISCGHKLPVLHAPVVC